MRLSARLANDSRLVGATGGTDVGNGGVDIVDLRICLCVLKYLFYLKLLIVLFFVFLASSSFFFLRHLSLSSGWLAVLCAKMGNSYHAFHTAHHTQCQFNLILNKLFEMFTMSLKKKTLNAGKVHNLLSLWKRNRTMAQRVIFLWYLFSFSLTSL